MLLSQSQVTACVCAFVIITSTAALFLSGYVLQQRTVAELRALIPPPPANLPAYSPDYILQTQLSAVDPDVAFTIPTDKYFAAAGAPEEPPEPKTRGGKFDRLDNGLDVARLGAEAAQREQIREGAEEEARPTLGHVVEDLRSTSDVIDLRVRREDGEGDAEQSEREDEIEADERGIESEEREIEEASGETDAEWRAVRGAAQEANRAEWQRRVAENRKWDKEIRVEAESDAGEGWMRGTDQLISVGDEGVAGLDRVGGGAVLMQR